MDVNIIDTVNRQLVDLGIQSFENKERDYSHFHASQWDKCHRQIAYCYYHALGLISVDAGCLKNTISAQGQRIFDAGHTMHDRWRTYLERSGALMGVWECRHAHVDGHPEVSKFGENEKLGILRPEKCTCGRSDFIYREVGFLDEETMWGGHVDAIIDTVKFRQYQLSMLRNGKAQKEEGIDTQNIEDRYLVVDFKSMNPRQFEKLERPLSDHITQIQIYLYLSGLRYGKFIYEDKGLQAAKEYLVVRDEPLLRVKKFEALELKRMVKYVKPNGKRALPDRKHKDSTHRDCLQCNFRGHCWKGG